MKSDPVELVINALLSPRAGDFHTRHGYSKIEVAKALHQGIDAKIVEQLQSHIPLPILCETLDLNQATLQRRVTLDKRLSARQADSLLQLAQTWLVLMSFFGHDKHLLCDWLDSDLSAFEGMKPRAMLQTNFGRGLLLEAIEAMKYGEVA